MSNRVWRGALALLLLFPATGALARTCPLTVDSDDSMRFAQTELRVAADCTQVRLTLRHSGRVPATAMGHNWVLTRTADYRSVAIAEVLGERLAGERFATFVVHRDLGRE